MKKNTLRIFRLFIVKILKCLFLSSLIFSGCIFSLFFGGCSEKEQQEPLYIKLNTDTLTFESDGGNQTIEVSSNGDWIVSGETDWCTVSPLTSKGNLTVAVSVLKNDSPDERKASLIFSCGAKTDTVKIIQKSQIVLEWGRTEDGKAVMIIDATTVSQNLQSISDNGTLIFSSLPDKETPKAGDIICSAPAGNAPRGFLYRVTKIGTQGGNTIIETGDVSLEEAIENADMSETISLDDNIAGIFDEEGNPIEYTTSSDGLRAGVAGKTTITISRKLIESDDKASNVTLAGSLTLSNNLEFEMNVQKWHLQYMKLAYTVGAELKATVSGELKGKISKSIKIASIKLTPITVLAAGVPVVITPEIPINLRGELSGTIKGECTLFDNKNSITVGVLYQNNVVDGIFKSNPPESQSLADRMKVSVSGELKATVEPGVSFLLYNSSNASIGATVGVYGKATLTLSDNNEMQIIEDLAYDRRYALNPNLKVSMGVEAGVNATLKIFALKLLDYKATGTIYERELLRGSVFPQFTDISISDKTDNSAKATATVQTPSYFNFIFPVSQHGICISQTSLPTVENSLWYNELDALPTTWTNTSVPVVSAELTNLKPTTIYYVCPYFINTFGTYYGKVQSFALEKKEDTCESFDNPDGVVINGVRWATRNVGTPGAFASSPCDPGMFYQWNCRTGWPAIGSITGWDNRNPTGDTWAKANDPSPTGWRVPTLAEIQKLLDTNNVTNEWIDKNGLTGMKFIDKVTGNTLFLPIVNYRFYDNGDFCNSLNVGNMYWSSTAKDALNAYYLYFCYTNVCYTEIQRSYRSYGLSIRPVAE